MAELPAPEPADERAALLARARTGDEEALGRLIDSFRPQLLALAGSMMGRQVGDKADASDVVQQGLVSACRGLESFRGQTVEDFQGWLATIVRNETRDVLRFWHQQRRDVGREQSMFAEGETLLDPAVADRTPDERDAVRLRHLEGWSLERIAAHLGRTEAGAAGLLKRAVQRLRARLKEPD